MNEIVRNLSLTCLYFLYLFMIDKYLLHMFQQNRYELMRFVKWAIGNYRVFLVHLLIIAIGCGVVYFVTHTYNQTIASIVTIWFYCAVLIGLIIVDTRKKNIHPLNYTWRVRRQLIVLALLNGIILYVVLKEIPAYWTYLMAAAWPAQWLLIIVMHAITLPIENGVKLHYKNLAKDKLKNNPAKVIGITGSFGKTSSKVILNDLLSKQFITLMTPASFNTPMGITRTIRGSLKPTHQLFICEMGADHKGDIKELMEFVHPQMGLVTSIGEQHLNTFHSLENIINEKMLEIEMLPINGVGFINIDNQYIRNYNIKNTCKIVTFGLSEQADYQAINIQYNQDGSTFEIVYQGLAYPFKTRLLGKNNIYNILSAVAIARELGVSWENCVYGVRAVKPIEHRLQKRIINGYLFIDNAFNSNPTGAYGSLEVLKQMSGTRVCVTPGFIDLGIKQDHYNHLFGTQMKDHCDLVILVGKIQTQAIYAGLQESGFDMNNVVVVDKVVEAFNYVYQHVSRNSTILLENDLPDAFNH